MGDRNYKSEKAYLEIVACVAQVLLCNGINSQKTVTISRDVGAAICQKWGGGSIYIPKLQKDKICTRNSEIFDKFDNGASHADLAMEYNLTERQVYTIIGRMRKHRRALAKKTREESCQY